MKKPIWMEHLFKSKYPPIIIKDIKLFFKEIHSLLSDGYPLLALWSTDMWFIKTMKSIIIWKRDHGHSLITINGESTKEANVAFYNYLLSLLDKMSIFDNPTETCIEAKNKFFKLFSEYFYEFWD